MGGGRPSPIIRYWCSGARASTYLLSTKQRFIQQSRPGRNLIFLLGLVNKHMNLEEKKLPVMHELPASHLFRAILNYTSAPF